MKPPRDIPIPPIPTHLREENRKPLFSFIPATWRGTTAVNHETRMMGISFDTENGTVRLKLDVDSARHLSESIAEMLQFYEERRNVHPERSDGIPNREVSPAESHS